MPDEKLHWLPMNAEGSSASSLRAAIGVAVKRAGAAARSNCASLRFAFVFATIASVLFVAYCFPYAENGVSEAFFQWYLSGYARLAGGLLGLLEPSLTVVGTQINGRFSIQIVKNCDAMEVNILFFSAMMAFPAAWSRRLTATLLGLAILVAANLIRICSLYYIGVYAHGAFELAHMQLFPLLLIITAVLEFILWTNWMQKRPSPTRA
jgi:exosortase/archaeosortase family protein